MNHRGHIAGVDEVGRGCLAGPVVAAAVILNPATPIPGLDDSKALSAKKRETLAIEIRANALAYAIGQASVEEIDRINILQASLLAMQRAICALPIAPKQAWIDGNRAPTLPMTCKTFIGGDALHDCISAASILAKTHRDALLVALDVVHPVFGLAKHKGYGTALHLAALRAHPPMQGLHRMSFAPVRAASLQHAK